MQSESFISSDGVNVRYQTMGAGPAVIVVPRVLSVAYDYGTFAGALAEGFTVHTLERRGHGESSPQPRDYSIATDIEDVRTLQKKIGARCVFGHSYGGLIALESARNNSFIESVAVYEPGVSVNGSMPVTWSVEYEKLLGQNQRLDAFVAFSTAVAPMKTRKMPRWVMKRILPAVMGRNHLREKLDMLESNLREHEQIAALDDTYRNYAEISAQALLLYGGKSDLPWVKPAIEKWASVLPSAQVKNFPRLDHLAPGGKGASELAQSVNRFFSLRM